MAYSVKTINGRKYLYHQHSYRVGKKVKTHSKYIGPVWAITAGVQLAVKGRSTFKKQSESLAKNLNPEKVGNAMARVALGTRLDQARADARQKAFDDRDRSIIWERAVAEEKSARESANLSSSENAQPSSQEGATSTGEGPQ